MNFISRLICILSISLLSVCANAQTAADKLFAQGQSKQAIMTVKAQNEAINLFSKAKKAYDSQANKKKCDSQIGICRNTIKALGPAGKSGKRGKAAPVVKEPVVEATLAVNPGNMLFKCISTPGKYEVTTNQSTWEVKVLPKVNGSDFVTVTKLEDNSGFTVECSDNTTYVDRQAIIEVIAGDKLKTITVTQEGVPVNFVVERTALEYKKKGGKDALYVSSDYKMTYDDNNGKNWHVASKPEWISVVAADKKNENVFKKGLNAMAGKDNAPVDSDKMVSSVANIIIDRIQKDSPEYSTGRKGEIILESGNKQLRILVRQD